MDDKRNERVFKMAFASVYPHYVQKAEKKGRTKNEVDEVICWLTGYSPKALAQQIEQKTDFRTFFGEAPSLHPNASKITGTILERAPSLVGEAVGAHHDDERSGGRARGVESPLSDPPGHSDRGSQSDSGRGGGADVVSGIAERTA